MSIINNAKMLSGRYKILEQIGIGGMSYVYKARDTLKRRDVAIKILKEELTGDKDLVKRFKDEATQSKKINHENVVSVYDLVDENELHYIVMEYLDGVTLTKYIQNKGRLSNEETVDIAIKIAEGLKAAHKEGIIHRDIKPQNIVIKDNGACRITDFGIARAISSTTQNVSVVGTVHYISPEQASNGIIDYRSDIYSLGCTIYEMITGIVPFEGESPVNIIVSHIRSSIKKPSIDNPDIYKSLEKVIMKATKIIPRERYQTADELINDLKKVLSDKEGTFIKEDVYDDTEGKTVIISDEQMKFIKNVSLKYTNASTNFITPDQSEKHEAFNQKYINKSIIDSWLGKALIGITAFLIIVVVFISINFLNVIKEKDTYPATGSIATRIRASQIIGLDVDVANVLLKDYAINIEILGSEYNDQYDYGKIISVDENNSNGSAMKVYISKGPLVLSFSDTKKLNEMRFSDLAPLLDERKLIYSTIEAYDSRVEKGYIIGCNKKMSNEKGGLIFTISKGLGEDMLIMPDLYNKNIDEVNKILAENDLHIGKIGKKPDVNVDADNVISQSITKGKVVSKGAGIDVILSSGYNGDTVVINDAGKYIGSLNTNYVVSHGNSGVIEIDGERKINIKVRLKQNTDNGIKYTTLIEPAMYIEGTSLPLIFEKIEGEIGVKGGDIEVVDCRNDEVLATYNIIFNEV